MFHRMKTLLLPLAAFALLSVPAMSEAADLRSARPDFRSSNPRMTRADYRRAYFHRKALARRGMHPYPSAGRFYVPRNNPVPPFGFYGANQYYSATLPGNVYHFR